MKKVEELKKSGKVDLSLDEDLSIAVMNEIRISPRPRSDFPNVIRRSV